MQTPSLRPVSPCRASAESEVTLECWRLLISGPGGQVSPGPCTAPGPLQAPSVPCLALSLPALYGQLLEDTKFVATCQGSDRKPTHPG